VLELVVYTLEVSEGHLCLLRFVNFSDLPDSVSVLLTRTKLLLGVLSAATIPTRWQIRTTTAQGLAPR